MHTISLSDAKELVRHVAVRLRRPVMLWGPPGVGKTAMMTQLATELGALLCDFRAALYDSVDARGFPLVSQEGMTVWAKPSTLPFKGNPLFSSDRTIILFLDEINTCSRPMFTVCMQLVNERRVGEHELMDNVVIVGAGNREGDRGTANPMPTTMSNRFTHAEVGHDVDGWCAHQQARGIAPVAIAFHQFRKPLISTFDPSKPDKTFATERTWEWFWDYYADDKMSEATKQTACAGVVGDGPAAEAWGFVDVWQKMIPMSAIEKDPTGVPVPEELSMQYAVAVAISGTMTPKNVKQFHKFLIRMSPEFVMLAWQMAVKRDKKLYATNEFLDFSKRFEMVVR